MRNILIGLALLLLLPAVAAAGPLVDPGIPDGETSVYTVRYGRETMTLNERIVRRQESGALFYEVTSESPRQDLRLRLDAARMTAVYAWTREKSADLVLETEKKTIRNTLPAGADELTLNDFSGLIHQLRGYPFGKLRTLRLKFATGSSFVLTVTHTKDVDVKTAAGTFRCRELELGAEGLMGAFMPKTYFWYASEAPHFLVRYQGQSAGPGSPELVLELAGRTVK